MANRILCWSIPALARQHFGISTGHFVLEAPMAPHYLLVGLSGAPPISIAMAKLITSCTTPAPSTRPFGSSTEVAWRAALRGLFLAQDTSSLLPRPALSHPMECQRLARQL